MIKDKVEQLSKDNNALGVFTELAGGLDDILNKLSGISSQIHTEYNNINTDIAVIEKKFDNTSLNNSTEVYSDYELFKLNQQGKSYADLERITGIKKSTIAKKIQKIRLETKQLFSDEYISSLDDDDFKSIFIKLKREGIKRGIIRTNK